MQSKDALDAAAHGLQGTYNLEKNTYVPKSNLLNEFGANMTTLKQVNASRLFRIVLDEYIRKIALGNQEVLYYRLALVLLSKFLGA